jgi:phenylpyruvate tautomerase PptA (4-oxalocrotonate tautomerase family)
VALLMCDIRQGREKETRAELARQLVEACIEICGLDETTINVEFTQHAGDEMYHTMYGGLSDDWQAGQPDTLNGRAP